MIQGKHFVGELYGNPAAIPVIALHGWLDNCRSFSLLAPLLDNTCVLALDMAGHGHSDHRSQDASYHIWDDVREILLIADQMGWQQFCLLGHSRGAIIAALVAAVAPQRISRLVLIEGFWPQVMKDEEAPAQLASFVDRYLCDKPKESVYPDIDAMVDVRCKSGFGMSRVSARLIVDRNATAVTHGYRWVTDQRLNMPSPQMLTEAEALAFLAAIRCPSVLLLASQGIGKSLDYLKPRFQAIPGLGVIMLEGNHHLHMEGAEADVARVINHFLMQ